MKRKVIKQRSSYTITLPVTWVKQLNLKPSTEVEVNELGKKLVVSAERLNEKKSIEIKINGQDSGFVWREILGLYRKGYDEIIISHSDQISLLREIANYLIGFEITKQEENKVTIEDIAGLENANFDLMFKRVGFILVDLTQEIYFMLQKKINENEIIVLDRNLDKFTDYCLRYLNKKGLESFDEIPIFYYLVSQIEYIGDVYKQAAFSKPKKQEIILFERINKIIKEFIESINLENDDDRAKKSFEVYCELKKLEKGLKKDSITIAYLGIIINLIKNCLNFII
jgi:phosphate uptake regulator